MSDVGGEQVQTEPVQVCEGRWRTRGGKIRDVIPTPDDDERAKKYPWYDAKYDQTWQNNGRYYLDEENQRDLVEYLGPIEPDKTQELPDKTQELQAEYTPPEGWCVLAVGEVLRDGDMWVNHEGESRPTKRVGETVNDERYIRPIEPQPQSESQPEPQHNGLVRDVTHLLQESGVLDSAKAEQQIEELRSEVSHVQRLLGESRQRVTQLEELVTSLRTINEAQEKSIRLAGQANTDLQHRLDVVSAEWAEQTERFRQLQQANDRLAQLETLQPIAAACHTAQTMVRDMLGHMRCLLALHHTTDRRDSCTLLESILEVFDDAECDEDEDEDTDTTNTSEAKQG